MENLKKGGIATIIAVVVMVGICIALIISTVMPMADQTQEMGKTSKNVMGGLTNAIKGS